MAWLDAGGGGVEMAWLVDNVQMLGGFGAVAFIGWLYYRNFMRRRRAEEAKCPVCRSRSIDADRSGGIEVLPDPFRCEACGVDSSELDGETADIVDVLVSLQAQEPALARIRNHASLLYFAREGSEGSYLAMAEDDLKDAWETLVRLSEEHPDVFSRELDDGRELGDYVESAFRDTGTVVEEQYVSFADWWPRRKRLMTKFRAFRSTWKKVHETLADAVRDAV